MSPAVETCVPSVPAIFVQAGALESSVDKLLKEPGAGPIKKTNKHGQAARDAAKPY